MHLHVAQWYDEKLESAEHAGTHYQYALAIEPENASALAAFENLLERFHKWDVVVQVLQRRVDVSVDPDERKAAYEKMAAILEDHLDKPEDAIEAWRQVLLLDETDVSTLRALERLYAMRERWQDLIDALNRQSQLAYEDQEQVELHLRIGELWEGRLGAPDRAVDAYRNALAVDDACIDAMQALEKLYTQQDRWYELLEVYEMMLNVRTEPDQQLNIYSRMAMIQEEELQDIPGTIDTYRKMMLVDPASTAALRALERLYRDNERWDDLADVYMQHLERSSTGVRCGTPTAPSTRSRPSSSWTPTTCPRCPRLASCTPRWRTGSGRSRCSAGRRTC
jgi:tetratricopeptide (TPR) repeat protein